MPENFLEINRYFALTSYCNTIGQSNNAFSILGFSLAGKRRVHVLTFFLAYKRNNKHLPKHLLRSYENRSIPIGNVCSISSKPSLIPVPGNFSKWFTVQLVCTNVKRDSEPNFTSPEFYVPFAQGEDRPVTFLFKTELICLFVCFCFADVVQKDLKSTLRILYSLFQKYKKYEITFQLDFLLCVDWWNSHSV